MKKFFKIIMLFVVVVLVSAAGKGAQKSAKTKRCEFSLHPIPK